MKNVFILILFLILFSINVYAQEQIEINLFRENQIANEVFQAEIILNEKPEKDLTINNLILSNNKKISIAPLFTKISENKYFVYFDLPSLENGTYSFTIENLLYKVDNRLTQISKSVSFNLSTSSSIVKIKPGFIKVDEKNKNFEITVIGNANIEIKTSDVFTHPYDKEIVSGSRKFKFATDFTKVKSPKEEIKIIYDDRSYIIPIYIFKEEIKIPEKVEINETKEIKIKFLTDLTSINKTIKKDQVLKGALKFKNYFNQSLYNLTFKLTGNLNEIVRLNQTLFEEIKPGETLQQYVWVNEQKNPLQSYYSGAIVLNFDNYDLEFPIYIAIEEVAQINKTEEIEEVSEELFKVEEISKEPIKGEKKSFKKSILIFILIILIIIILILFNKKEKPKYKTFKEYIKSIEKR